MAVAEIADDIRVTFSGVSFIVEQSILSRDALLTKEGLEEVIDAQWLAARVDVGPGAEGWVTAWIADCDTGKRLFDLAATPIEVTGRKGTVARILFEPVINDGPKDDPRLECNLVLHSDARDQEIRQGRSRLTIPPEAAAAEKAAWAQRETRARPKG